jgi:UDP-N-acetylmuramoyl-L-alanine---L-glutamate ligase
MHIRDLNGKSVCILGFGKEGQAMLHALESHAPSARVTIADRNASLTAPESMLAIELQTGPGYLRDLHRFDTVIKSPGIPPKAEIDAAKDTLTSGTQIFLDTIAESGAIVIGVTGSKGKSTTSTLIYALLTTGGKEAFLIGNIGEPSIAHVDDAKAGTIFVLEMSSYQLMDLTRSPQVAVVTSFFPEHLDYHGSLEAYKEAKKHIARFQKPEDVVFFNAKSPGATEIALEGEGKKAGCSDEDAPVNIEETKLLGRHNLSNIALACAVATHFGVPKKTQLKVLKDFRGLPHRLQSLGIHHGIEWIDDAISTTPDSAIAALDALGDRVTTIILGGQDRGVPFETLGKRIAVSSIRTVILFPGSGPRIREAISEAKADVCFHDSPTMEDAVKTAKKKTPEGSICLLSTASPSYGMFKNFEEKGGRFRECVEKM